MGVRGLVKIVSDPPLSAGLCLVVALSGHADKEMEYIMKKIALTAMVLGLGLAACEAQTDDAVENDMENAGEAMEADAEAAGDAVEGAAMEAGDAADNAMNEMDAEAAEVEADMQNESVEEAQAD